MYNRIHYILSISNNVTFNSESKPYIHLTKSAKNNLYKLFAQYNKETFTYPGFHENGTLGEKGYIKTMYSVHRRNCFHEIGVCKHPTNASW